ncbi:uncharacterized protein LOC129590658 [Paramacrobiotus metropolitanus]|uniref:uncharacterized protein LOC129590658 n=1 Tax=Paramacrobiotus metropolitanus TaxID=2943436 RepID=UPI0024462272|nr:uncharacterized protein LOC129590658 [Paramacrobiotus metropolitanus]
MAHSFNKFLQTIIAVDEFEPEEIALFLAFHDQEKSEQKASRKKFALQDISDQQCVDWFRFQREDIELLRKELLIPDVVRTESGSICEGTEALCILLRRLAYPCRYTDLTIIFHRSITELCMACHWVIEHIYCHFIHLLNTLDLCWLTRDDLQGFADAALAKGAPLDNVWGYIDGTVRPICRPSEGQRVVWNAHYRLHSMIFQSVVATNGMIVNLDGPWPGRRHDAGILADSGLIDKLREKMVEIGKKFILYGDPAYPSNEYIEAQFRRRMAPLPEDQEQFNEAAILTNCHTALYGSQTGIYFGVDPPSLKEYLRNVRINED